MSMNVAPTLASMASVKTVRAITIVTAFQALQETSASLVSTSSVYIGSVYIY